MALAAGGVLPGCVCGEPMGDHAELATAKVKLVEVNWSIKGIWYNILASFLRNIFFLVS